MVRGQLLATEISRGDGHGPGPEGAPAIDIVRGVADHENILRRKFHAVFFQGARPRKFAKLVAVVMIIRIGAEFEKMPDAVMGELDLRAA